MISIDLEKGNDGVMGGDIQNIIEEYRIITMYVYRLFINSSVKNKTTFKTLVRDAVKESKILEGVEFERTLTENLVTKKDLEEIDKIVNKY